MPSPAPKVSVIMATYNRSGVLPYSIGSVLDQTFDDFELLVVGDGCTDDSADVVGAIRDERVQWIGLEENSGHQSTPNNIGLGKARGEIIAYIGHDDLWFPDHLAGLVAAIEAGADLAHSAIYRPGSPDEPTRISALARYEPGATIPPSCVAHRRSIIAETGGWRDYREVSGWPETDLWRRFHGAGYRFASVSKVSVIKITAGTRRDVYRERPSHEQAYWLERIRIEPDLASALPLQLIADTVAPASLRYIDLIRLFAGETRDRLLRRVKGTHGWGKPGEAVARSRRFKGLDPLPPGERPAVRTGDPT